MNDGHTTSVTTVDCLHWNAASSSPASLRTTRHHPATVELSGPGRRRQVGLRHADISTARKLTERLQKHAAKFLSDGAVEDEVDSAVDVDEQVSHV